MLLLDGLGRRTGPVCRQGCYLHSFYCWGFFDGATAHVEASPDGETWFVVHRFTEKGYVNITLTMPFLRARLIEGEAPLVRLMAL